MEIIKPQGKAEKLNEFEYLSKKIRKVHLYDTIKFVACVGAIGACCEIALFSNSKNTQKTALSMAAGASLVHIGVGQILNKKKQKLLDRRTQVLKELKQYCKA